MSHLSDYYLAAQLRSDRWSALKTAAAELAQRDGDDPEALRPLRERIAAQFEDLAPSELYWAFPGIGAFGFLRDLAVRQDDAELARAVRRVARALATGAFRRRQIPLAAHEEDADEIEEEQTQSLEARALHRPYFEVLIVDEVSEQQAEWLKISLARMRRNEDLFTYEPVIVPCIANALAAVLCNPHLQAVVVRPGMDLAPGGDLSELKAELRRLGAPMSDPLAPRDYGLELCRLVGKLRPELDIYLVTDRSVEEIAGHDRPGCRRVFYNQEDFLELHLNILRGVGERFTTPFFNALKDYSKQPTGVFHAMPISRGKSVSRSHWIQDMGAFYGHNIFLAETSATSGGLDSLLEPHGPIKRAQQAAARAFGAKQTFFATNGTSTCNKIVVQALVKPGDIVLVDRDCHKSHHYGFVLAGAEVVYLDSYPLDAFSMYGAVPIAEIKRALLKLRAQGKLDRVAMLLLTNCTFDGLVYNVERVMRECLAIKRDLVFLWDEAWFAFARFDPIYRRRTAMAVAAEMRKALRAPAAQAAWEAQQSRLEGADDATLLATELVPPPDARIRVYATQSTHKTLTALRQGSMIHVYDQDFRGGVEQAFHEAYMTHTSTSPNYQIVASLDVGRRQVELEGFDFVQRQIAAAMAMRRTIATHPLLKKYFRVLERGELIPEAYRSSASEDGPGTSAEALQARTGDWGDDEFVLDATRVTLMVGHAGWDGDTFKTQVLMEKHGIQINKTSRNTVLFMTNIGTTRSSVAYLIEVLVQVAKGLDSELEDASPMTLKAFRARVRNLTETLPPLPDFSRFHDAFRADPQGSEGDIRSAFFHAYDEANCEYLALDGSVTAALDAGREVVSATFIIPYPPGFPILVPGQVISRDILAFMRALDVSEIHGYQAEMGLRVFTDAALAAQLEEPMPDAAE